MRKRRSTILQAVHETATGLHAAGALDPVTVHEYDRLCLGRLATGDDASPIPPTEIAPAAFAQANAAGRRRRARGPLATTARFLAGHVHVELHNGCAFIFPAALSQDLAGARAKDLREIEVTAGGLGLHFPRLDADLYVPNLLKGVLGTKRWMSQIGALEEGAAPKAQPASSDRKLGNRPRKTTTDTT